MHNTCDLYLLAAQQANHAFAEERGWDVSEPPATYFCVDTKAAERIRHYATAKSTITTWLSNKTLPKQDEMPEVNAHPVSRPFVPSKAPAARFEVPEFNRFLDQIGGSFSPRIREAYEYAIDVIQQVPVSTATFKVNIFGMSCVGLELLAPDDDGTFHRTGTFVAYVIDNERITPIDVAQTRHVHKSPVRSL